VTLQVSARPGTETTNEWVGEAIRRVAAVPSVETVGGVGQLRFELGPIGTDSWVLLGGQQADTPEAGRQNPSVNYQGGIDCISPDYRARVDYAEVQRWIRETIRHRVVDQQ